MFMCFKCVLMISNRSLLKVNKLTQSCFSVAADQYVNKARLLEKLKAEKNLPESLYQNGKYLIFRGNEKVCLDSNDKLLFKDYEDVKKWDRFLNSKIILLDVLIESGSNICLFAVDLKDFDEGDEKELEGISQEKFLDVRKCLFFLSNEESEYVTQARGLIHFCQSMKFCCFCSKSLEESESGHRKHCTNCNHIHYPTLSPVGLTLIANENHEQVLLVRQKRHPPGMYTCVAGFIEPGETLEENARREVAEEVGVKIDKVEYCMSLPWALPASQLALGCIATTKAKEINIDPNEIENAKWVEAEALKDAVIRTRALKDLNNMDPEKLWSPPQNAVSHGLMVYWLKKYHNFNN